MEINELVIRVPGIGGEEGRLLGNDVAEKLSQLQPAGENFRKIDELKIAINRGTGMDRHQMAGDIARQIWNQINNH